MQPSKIARNVALEAVPGLPMARICVRYAQTMVAVEHPVEEQANLATLLGYLTPRPVSLHAR